MNLIKVLLSHQHDAVQSEVCAYIKPQDHLNKIAAISALLSKDVSLLVCNKEDVSQNVIVDEATLKYLIEVHNEFKFFTSSMCDFLYTELDKKGLDALVVKLKSGDTVTCDLKWEQGRGNNYYFYNEYLGVRISIDSVIAYKFI